MDHRVVVLGDQIPIDNAGENRREMVVDCGVCGPVEPLAVDAFETRQQVEAEQSAEGKRNFALPMAVVLRVIWRSLYGDIWRRGLSRRSIAAFRGDSTGFDNSDVNHLPFMTCRSSP
jgi:hypothetical protein